MPKASGILTDNEADLILETVARASTAVIRDRTVFAVLSTATVAADRNHIETQAQRAAVAAGKKYVWTS